MNTSTTRLCGYAGLIGWGVDTILACQPQRFVRDLDRRLAPTATIAADCGQNALKP